MTGLIDVSIQKEQPNWLGLVTAGMDARRKYEAHDAFGQLVTNPNDPAALARLARNDPELAYKYNVQNRKDVRETQVRDLTRQAVQGDQNATNQLAGLDIDTWAKIGSVKRDQMKQQNETVGNLALWADTPEKWANALNQARQRGIDVTGYDDFNNRQAVLAQSGMMKEFIAQNEAKWVTPGEAGAFNARDPASVAAWIRSQGGGGEVQAPAPQSARSPAGGADLTQMARDAIAAGADPAAVRARMQQMRGGASPQGGDTFP